MAGRCFSYSSIDLRNVSSFVNFMMLIQQHFFSNLCESNGQGYGIPAHSTIIGFR